jgi:hypothetical protein
MNTRKKSRKYKKGYYNKKRKLSIGRIKYRGGMNNNLRNMITLSILSYKSPLTIRNTLESYRKNKLFDMVTSHIYFQERNNNCDSIAKEFNIEHIFGTAENVGILKAFQSMVTNTTTPYFIFAECDFELINDQDKTKNILEDCIKLITKENVKLVRLRDRHNPGVPDYARALIPVSDENLSTYSYNSFKHKLDGLLFLDDIEKSMPNVFTVKGPPEYKYKWYICDFNNSRWGNNIFIASTQFLKDTILPYISKFADDPKYTMMESLLWEESSPIHTMLNAGGDGLFKHNRLDR